MKAHDHIYQLFAEANPAPLTAVSKIDRPEPDSLLQDHRSPNVLTQEPKILEPRGDESRTRHWRGPAIAFASFAVAAAVLGTAIWLSGGTDEAPDVADPGVATTQVPTPTTVPPVTAAPPGAAAITIPDLVGLSVADARDVAETVGFELVVVEGDFDAAIIVAQEPVDGVEATEGAEVRVDAAVTPTCTPPAAPPPGTGEITISLLFQCGDGGTFPTAGIAVPRIVPEQGGEAADRIEWTLRSLLAGPTAEEQAVGFGSAFSDQTANALIDVSFTDGRVVADFNDAIYVNNASTSTGSLFFNAELRANLFQHPEVDSVEFHINGNCEAWSAYFESDGCQIITRSDWDQQVADWDAQRDQ